MATWLLEAKDPADIDQLVWDWRLRLADGETIDHFTATVRGGTWSIDPDTDIDGETTSAQVSGGAAGETCGAHGRIITSAGRSIGWTIYVPIRGQ